MATTRTCPECSADIEVLAGYPDWCDECEWNVHAPATTRWGYGSRFDAAMGWVGRRSGERLSRRMLAADDLRPRWTASRVAAYAIALIVIATSLVLMAGSIVILVIAHGNLLVALFSALGFGIGWFLRPRLGRMPRDHHVDAAEAPELHALVADVASALAIRPPDVLRLDPGYNASWAVVGWRRRRVLTLGTPLIMLLDTPELVALIAHELGHARNGDARDGLIVGSAAAGLAELCALLAPAGDLLPGAYHYTDALGPIARVLQRIVALPVLAVMLVEAHLLLGDSRRAEFAADALSARAAGTQAAVRLQERILLASAFELALQRAAHAPPDGSLFAWLRSEVDGVPAREQARRRAVARAEGTRLDYTHPPSGMRIALLEHRAPQPGLVVVEPLRERCLRDELAALEPQLARDLLDSERGRHYYG